MSTGITWTDETWNPTTGCTKVSAGCKNCYAERMAKRLAGREGYPLENPFALTLHPDRLDKPLRWRKPKRVFVDSMSDLFHRDVPDEFIDKVFAIMAMAPRHTFQVLTKRPERMAAYLATEGRAERIRELRHEIAWEGPWPEWQWPLPNVWLGTSVENQQAADERIPLLLDTPAAVRFISAEPLLGPVDLGELTWVSLPRGVRGDSPFQSTFAAAGIRRAHTNRFGAMSAIAEAGEWLGIKPAEMDWCRKLDWVIVGGESGPGARPMQIEWARDLVRQCREAGVPVLFKQWGTWLPADQDPEADQHPGQGRAYKAADGSPGLWRRAGVTAAGRLLDGELWDQYPEVRA